MTKFRVIKEFYSLNMGTLEEGHTIECDYDFVSIKTPNGSYDNVPLNHLEIIRDDSKNKKEAKEIVTFKDYFGQDVQQIIFK